MKRIRPTGLRTRLAVSIALIMLVVLGVAFFAAYRGTDSDLRDRIDTDLQREVEGLARSMTSGPPRTPSGYRAQADQLVLSQPFGPSSRVIAISIQGRGTATNQPELLGLPPVAGTPAATGAGPAEQTGDDGPGHGGSGSPGGEGSESEGSESEGSRSSDDRASARELLAAPGDLSTIPVEGVGELRLLTRRLVLPGEVGAVIRVGQPLAPAQQALDGLSDTFLVVGVLGLLLATAAGWILATRTTRPLRRITDVAEGVDGGELSERMPIGETRNDEVRRLAESFNHMLDRLELAFNRQRQFVGDASHDLRTPLTIIKGQLDVLSRNPEPGQEEISRVTEHVGHATDRMEKLIDDLLLLAKTDSGDAFQFEALETGPLLVAEVEGFRAAADRDFEIGNLTDTVVPVDRDQLSRAVSNLLSNAVAHTGPGGTIRLSAEDSTTGVAISIDDDGQGVPPDQRETVFDRFKRLDQSRSSANGGSGLGLAIVKAVAEAHGGSVSCTGSPLGGARFSIELPAEAAGVEESR